MEPNLNTPGQGATPIALDGDTLKLREQRFRHQHRLRLLQAKSRLPDTAGRVLSALPLLLHYNHPALPGYCGHQSPAGIHTWSASGYAIKQMQQLSPGFTPGANAFDQRPAQIDAVYFMGSVGSVAQTRASDIDIWVCLPKQHHPLMQKKLNAISRWAIGLGVELQCFCVDASLQRPHGQPYWRLLLDEFYRTGCWLAGKFPLWWLIPNIPDDQYANYAAQVQRFAPPNSTIDFGPIAGFTSLELYAAAIEELSRALTNPYKALLKLGLLESYASGMPALSARYKTEVLQGSQAPFVDSYILLAEQLEQFFSRHTMPLRRAFMQRAWLIKTTRANARLKPEGAWWSLAQRWGFSRAEIEHLRWPGQWILSELVDENHRVIAAFAHALSFASSLQQPAVGIQDNSSWNKQHNTLAEIRHAVMTHTQYGNRLLHALVPKEYRGQARLSLQNNLWVLLEGSSVILRRARLVEVLMWIKQQSLTLHVLSPAQRDNTHLRQLYFSLSAPRPLLFVNAELALQRRDIDSESQSGATTYDNPFDATASHFDLLTPDNECRSYTTLFSLLPELVKQPQIYHAAAIDRRDERKAAKLIELSRAARSTLARKHAFVCRLHGELCCLTNAQEGAPTLNRHGDAWLLWLQAPAASFEFCPAGLDTDLTAALGDLKRALEQPSLILDFNSRDVNLVYRDSQQVLILPLPRRPMPQLLQSMRLFIASQNKRQLTTPKFYQRGQGHDLHNLLQDYSWDIDAALRYRLIFQQQDQGWRIECGRETLFRREIDLKTLASIKRRVFAHRQTDEQYPVYITDVSTRQNTFVANLVAKVAIEQALHAKHLHHALQALRALSDPAGN